LFQVNGATTLPLTLSHPDSQYLMDRTGMQIVAFHGESRMPPRYGQVGFWEDLERDRPSADPSDLRAPGLAWVYPFGYYTILAAWMECANTFDDGLLFTFMSARVFSLVLLMVSLSCSYGVCRELGHSRRFGLALTAAIAFFPLTQFISAYVQPDNLSFALVSLIFYFAARARREPDRIGQVAVLGICFGVLLVTKPHHLVCTLPPTLVCWAVAARRASIHWRRIVLQLAAVGLPILVLGSIYLWTIWDARTYYGETAAVGRNVVNGLRKALSDFYAGATHRSFWGLFGWMDTPLVFHDSRTSAIVRGTLRVVTWIVLALALWRMRQVAASLWRITRGGRIPRAAELLVRHVPLNSLLMFTALMVVLYVRLDNRFGAQGRNWLPYLLPIFLTGVYVAPRVWRSRRIRLGGAVAAISALLIYDAAGNFYAWRSLRARYFDPHHEKLMDREAIRADDVDPGEGHAFSFETPRFVHALEVRYRLTNGGSGKAYFTWSWSCPGAGGKRPRWKTCDQIIEWTDEPAEKSLYVWINDTIDGWRLRTGDSQAGLEIRTVRVYSTSSSPTSARYNAGMDIDAALGSLAKDPAAPFDLAETALALARDEYPDVDIEAYLSELTGMAKEARRYMTGSLEKRVMGLSRYLCHEMGFRGNVDHYYDARNSYLNEVLDRRTGIPITLAAVAMAVGTRAGLPVVGVGLPGHFVAKAVDGKTEVLFDPFHGGRLLTTESCELLVAKSTGKPFRVTAKELKAAPLGTILARMLNNLKGIYLRAEDYGRARRVVERLRRLTPRDPTPVRDLGVCLLREGEPGKAIDHFTSYLARAAEAPDAPQIEMMLQEARKEVSRWN
jgi:regulator of sirC expression with transglutaminase-like and TPR domain